MNELIGSRMERVLSEVTEQTEVFGLLGRGFPRSFYKIFARVGRTWWCFEEGVIRVSDPISHQKYAWNKGSNYPTAAVWGRVGILCHYDGIERDGVQALLARAYELSKSPVPAIDGGVV